jgi:hypothetical protein
VRIQVVLERLADESRLRRVIFKRLVVLGLVLRFVQLVVIWIYVELKGITSISDMTQHTCYTHGLHLGNDRFCGVHVIQAVVVT